MKALATLEIIEFHNNIFRLAFSAGFPMRRENRLAVYFITSSFVDESQAADLPLKGAFKRKFKIQENTKIILYLGRINRTKGIDLLIGTLTSLVSALGISREVLFIGLLSEKDKIGAYVDSGAVVNVEPINVYGLVPLEAAACSTPVIVSRTNAISEVVMKGNFGFSVKYDNIYELAETMRKMLNDKDLLSELGQKGRKFVFENFNWTDKVVKLEKVYEEL